MCAARSPSRASSGMRTIHIDPTGRVKRCPDFPTDFHWTRLRALRADRLQRVLLRLPRRSAGAAAALARARRDGRTRAPRRVSATRSSSSTRRRSSPAPGPRARARGARCATPASRTDVAVARARRTRSPRSAPSASCERAYRGRRRHRLRRRRAHAGLRRLAHARRSSAARATRSRSCAPPASDYMEIARRGGGIHASVRDLRARSEDELFALAVPRLRALAVVRRRRPSRSSPATGCRSTTSSRRCASMRRLADALPMRIVPTWLGAHEIPLEYRERADGRREYRRPARRRDAARSSRARARPLRRRVLRARRVHGRRDRARSSPRRARPDSALKLHADELAPGGGAELAAELGATSADHLAAISDAGHRGARRRRHRRHAASRHDALPRQGDAGAGARAHRRRRRVALATDFNPGTSPTTNFPLILTLGVSQLRLSRRRSARRGDGERRRGAGARRRRPDSSRRAFPPTSRSVDVGDVRELPYWYGDGRCRGVVGARQTLSPP